MKQLYKIILAACLLLPYSVVLGRQVRGSQLRHSTGSVHRPTRC